MSPFRLPPVLGQRLETYRCFDFSGGLDVRTSATKLALLGERNKWLTKAKNVVLEIDGSVRKRWGMRSISDAAGLDGKHITGGHKFKTSNGTIRDIVATTGGTVYKIETDTTLSTLKSGLTTTVSASFATYNDILHMAVGTDVPQQYDGTTWAALGGSSPATASYFVAHGNRLFASTIGVPSRLYWSKLNASTDWAGTTDAGFMDVNPNDGGTVGPLVASNQELVILKTNRPYRLQGIGPATGFTVVDNLVPATGSIGANSNRGAIFAANDVWYTSPLGVHRLTSTQNFGDLEESFISYRVDPYFRPSTTAGVTPINAFPSLYVHTGAPIVQYDRGSNLLLVAANTSANVTHCDTILAYDLGTKAWSTWTFDAVTSISAMWPAENRSDSTQEVWLGLYDQTATNAMVAAFDRSTTSDYGANQAAVAISAQVRHVSHLGQPGVEKAPRHLYLYFAKESATTTMTLNLYADFKTTAVFTTTFDITSSTAETLVVKRIDLGGFTCEYLEVDLQQATAAKGFTLYGYQCDFRTRRTTRRAE